MLPTLSTTLFAPLVVLLLPIIFIIVFNFLLPSKRCRLPPGPQPWPIIGNIPHITQKLHISLSNIAKIHGQIISLKLGSKLVIVGSSSKAAIEILKNNDRLLSGRSIPKATPRNSQVLERIAIVWNPTCNYQWKFFRTMCRTQLFSAKAIESQAALREKKIVEMIEYLRSKEGQVVNIGEIVFATVFNTISNLLFSKDLINLENQRLKCLLSRMLELGAAPNLAEFFPVFEKFDPQGLRKEAIKCVQEIFGTWEIYIKERRRDRQAHTDPNTDFLDVFLSNGLDDDQINWLIMELFAAGVDTTTTTVEWAIAELLKNKQAITALKQELKTKIDQNPISESQVYQFPYLNACVKETLRLHPPAPFLIPRRANEACEIMNYTVPKNSVILVNVWAIGRDPIVWEDPLLFQPEKFVDSGLELKTQAGFDFLPFGSGRRMCAGVPMAIRQLPLILASLIHYFDWSLPNGEDPALLDMNDKFGITLEKEKPLLVLPKPIRH